MRRVLVLMAGMFALAGRVASAQGGASFTPAADTGYVEGVAQSAFGNVTSQSYGAEVGFSIMAGLQVFVEGGQIRDVATPDLGVNAQTIAGALGVALKQSGTAGAVGYSVKEPATFGVAGIRYLIPISGSARSPLGKAQPYVMAGGGIAKVQKNVAFTIAGTDVTGNLQQYGVFLGTDLSGSFTKPMLTLGGGVTWPAWRQLILDFQYRYGRIFADDQAIVAQRAGIGLGIKF
jgi:opacity protein-like surface antigen